VTCLAFRRGSHQLFSGSHDRTVKIWNLDELCYIDSLFGHQSEVIALDSLNRDRCLSTGRDRSLRLWKVVEETQLVFHGHGASIDAAAMINEESFFAGGMDGAVTLWSVHKKRPVHTVANAHGGTATLPRWVSAVAALPFSDLAASGSCDGFVRFWNADAAERILEPAFEAPLPGFINDLCFSSNGKFAVAAVGQEHRLGRWSRIPDAKNGLAIISFN